MNYHGESIFQPMPQNDLPMLLTSPKLTRYTPVTASSSVPSSSPHYDFPDSKPSTPPPSSAPLSSSMPSISEFMSSPDSHPPGFRFQKRYSSPATFFDVNSPPFSGPPQSHPHHQPASQLPMPSDSSPLDMLIAALEPGRTKQKGIFGPKLSYADAPSTTQPQDPFRPLGQNGLLFSDSDPASLRRPYDQDPQFRPWHSSAQQQQQPMKLEQSGFAAEYNNVTSQPQTSTATSTAPNVSFQPLPSYLEPSHQHLRPPSANNEYYLEETSGFKGTPASSAPMRLSWSQSGVPLQTLSDGTTAPAIMDGMIHPQQGVYGPPGFPASQQRYSTGSINMGRLSAAPIQTFSRKRSYIDDSMPEHMSGDDIYNSMADSGGLFRKRNKSVDMAGVSLPAPTYQSDDQQDLSVPPPDMPQEDLLTEDPDAKPRKQRLRYPGDMYTPSWVRYTGQAKEGYCDTCHPGKWLQLKNSAYWYHKQFFHGISSVSGKMFLEPVGSRVVDQDVTEGLCHQCNQWIPINNAKRKNSVLWYRHAHKCHVYHKPKSVGTKKR